MSDSISEGKKRGSRRSGSRRPVIRWIATLLILIVALAAIKPVYHWLKTRRADQLVAEGERLIQQGKINDGARKYSAALQLDPLDYKALSGGARLATKGGRAEALDLWEAVMRSPRVTDLDRRDYAAFLLMQGRITAGEKIVDELLKRNPDEPTLDLASRYAQKSGDNIKAVQFARIAAKREPTTDRSQFRLAELLSLSPDAPARAEARSILWKLAARSGDYKKASIESLANSTELNPEEQQRAVDRLTSLPADVTDVLYASDLRLRLHPEQAEQIYDETTAKWGHGDATSIVAVVRWLNLHLQAQRALALVTLESALHDDRLMLARLDAFAILGKWAEVESLLSRPDVSFDPVVIECFKARSAQGRNASLDAQVLWDRAIGLAASDPLKLRFIAGFADKSSAPDAAEKALLQLARFPEHASYAYSSLQSIAIRTGDTRAQRMAAEKMVMLRGEDPNAQGQFIYLNLLTGNDVPGNLEKAKQLVAKYPDRLSFRIAAALGHLRKQEAAPALTQFVGPKGAPEIQWSRTEPAWQAVYAAVLQANDKLEEAKQLASGIQAAQLRPEERELIAPILSGGN